MNKREECMKKSSMHAKDTFDYKKLVYQAKGFLESTFEEKTEEVVFTYITEGKKPLSQIQQEETEKKFRLLINIATLFESVKTYQVAITPENIYYDENYMPYLMKRDVYAPGKQADYTNFLENYKCLVGGLLSKKYSVEQLQNSGIAILDKDVRFQKIFHCEEIEGVQKELRKMKQAIEERQKRETKIVSKVGYTIWRVIAIIAILGLGICGGYTFYASQRIIPKQNAQITANQSFIKKDYVACVDSMSQYEPEDMSVDTRYILAYSYAVSESFKKEEIETIVSRLSVNSNEKELEYWIWLGRLQMKKAQEIALSLSDDKLLVYAYMKEADLLESDTTVSGSKKKERLDTLEKEIQELGDKYKQVEEAE